MIYIIYMYISYICIYIYYYMPLTCQTHIRRSYRHLPVTSGHVKFSHDRGATQPIQERVNAWHWERVWFSQIIHFTIIDTKATSAIRFRDYQNRSCPGTICPFNNTLFQQGSNLSIHCTLLLRMQSIGCLSNWSSTWHQFNGMLHNCRTTGLVVKHIFILNQER